ncbi:Ent-kaurene oxidase [Madurella mycetomatis]|uniref:Ent-kaurene oxidase n=1 Tax=Madurella mycetomatis TaxID=100816 RepID=A0A175VNS5_9PEZI|nr:Ent-kaurene oxidase [Madurella mycetomatis]
MATTLILIAATAAAWLLATIWRRVIYVPKVNITYFAFEGDNSATRYIAEAGSLLARGYEKVRLVLTILAHFLLTRQNQNQYTKNGQPFAIRNASDPKRPVAILPLRYLEEVKNAPQSKLSFPLFMEKVLEVSLRIWAARASNHDVLLGFDKLIQPMQEAVAKAYDKEMPPCSDWTLINPYHLIAQSFARIATRVLVGPELCEGRWLTLSRDYINSVTRAPGVVRHKYPPWLRWVAKYIEPSVHAVLKYRREGAELLRPVLEARIAELDNTVPQTVGGKERHERQHEDAIQWLLEEFRARGKKLTPDTLAQSIYVIMTAAVDSTSSTALWMLFDLLDHPDAMAEIREEILRVSGGSADFVWTRQALGELRVLDSFMRESLRVHSFTQITVERMAAEPFTFKDGLHIPKFSQLAFPRYPYGMDSDVNPDPKTFDYKRHLKKRTGEDATKFHFASVSDDTLAWGTGMHACPGRFLAQEALKLIFLRLVSRYDIKHDGEKRPGPDRMMGLFMGPDASANILVKEVSSSA